MPAIMVDQTTYMILLVSVIILPLIPTMILIIILKTTPEAWFFFKLRRSKDPMAIVHYSGRTMRFYKPTIDKRYNEISTPFWRVGDTGIKFKDISGQAVELWDGNIPTYHFFKNLPEPIATLDAVAYHQLANFFEQKGIHIKGIEDIAMYMASEAEKFGSNNAVQNAKITDEELKNTIIKFLNQINENKKEIEHYRLTSGLFTYQIAMRALDASIAYTSANVAHALSVVEASVRHQIDSESKQLLKYGIFVMLILVGIGALIKLVG